MLSVMLDIKGGMFYCPWCSHVWFDTGFSDYDYMPPAYTAKCTKCQAIGLPGEKRNMLQRFLAIRSNKNKRKVEEDAIDYGSDH